MYIFITKNQMAVALAYIKIQIINFDPIFKNWEELEKI